jgi:hypothetical protein
MRDGNVWTKPTKMTDDDLMKILKERINSIDFENAAQDVTAFIKDPAEVAGWNKELFLTAIKNIKTEQ